MYEKLYKPSNEFLGKVRTMEKKFICHHGKKTLQPGKEAIKKLSAQIAELVSLPAEVVTLFIRCRTFFRIKILNRGLLETKKNKE